ncbi:MAG: hypothetical protein H8E74_00695 [Gammaproteobacteria bacterium]|nr:hypothetical protein [Gammaproteobacteria bacterium]
MEIACRFQEVGELEPTVPWTEGEKKKLGKYSGGNLNVKGFGYKNWVVLAYIIPDKPVKEYLEQGLTEQQIVEGCIEFLNQPPTKRARKPKYGKLSYNKHYLLEGKISVSLVIDQKNSKYFWGRGTNKHSMDKRYSGRGITAKGVKRK